MVRKPSDRPAAQQAAPDGIEQVLAALETLRYGEVRIVVQDGVIVQIERTEKMRLPRPQSK